MEKWLDAIYTGLYRAKQGYGEKSVEICKLAIKFGLYPWEMMEAARHLEHGVHPDEVIWTSLERLLDECDSVSLWSSSHHLKKIEGFTERVGNGDQYMEVPINKESKREQER